MKLVYVKKSDIGVGLFANELIKKGDTILKFDGPIITLKDIGKKPRKDWGDPLQIESDKFIDLEEPGRSANHSCNPTAGIKNNVYLVALKKISKDQEITWDYSTTVDNDWSINCKCKSKNCRKIIGKFKDLPVKIQKKHLKLGIVEGFIVDPYKEINKK